jgi:hypothetical protein
MRIIRFLMDYYLDDPYQIARRENLVMVLAHFFLLIFFLVFDIPILLYFDIFSIVFYISMRALIETRKIFLYEILAYSQVLVFMTIGSVLLGNRAGFFYYTMILMPLTFLLNYAFRRVSHIIKETCHGCTVGRWGGEEFLIIGSEPEDEPKKIMETVRNNISKENFTYEKQIMHVMVTIGAARYEDGDTVESWIKMADSKNYEGKNQGKNCVIL